LAAFAPVPGTELGVLVRQPADAAFAHVRDLLRRTMFWLAVCVAVALVVGVGLARDVSGRVAKLRDGTVTLAAGRFDARLDERGRDEVAELAGAFNRMAGDLGKATAELARWNAELEQRVAHKTRELKDAQDMLLRAR